MKAEDTTTSQWGRGTCTACGRKYNLSKDGNVRKHVNADTRLFCDGAGKPPKGQS